MTDTLKCWRCGASLAALSLPLTRLDECPECAVHLHVCRMCGHYDSGVARTCREDDAEEVKEKERANFCDYFAPSAMAFDSQTATADRQARQQLEQLFGDAANDAGDEPNDKRDDDTAAAEDLFK